MKLDGYYVVQESSTDEEVASSFTLQPVSGISSVDSAHQQQHSPQNTHSNGAFSPFNPQFLGQQCWRAMDNACFEIQSLSCTDSQSQIMEYICKIEADLEHLKKVEESYTFAKGWLAQPSLISSQIKVTGQCPGGDCRLLDLSVSPISTTSQLQCDRGSAWKHLGSALPRAPHGTSSSVWQLHKSVSEGMSVLSLSSLSEMHFD